MFKAALAYSLPMLLLIALFSGLMATSPRLYAWSAFMAGYVLVSLAPAVFGSEMAVHARGPWQRVLVTTSVAWAAIAAFAVMGAMPLWLGLLLAPPLSMLIEWRAARRRNASHDA